MEEMSAACAVSRSMLSEIERGRANPTLAVAYRIALAFGMSLGELVEAPAATHRVDVIRADDRTYHFRSDRNCRIRTRSPRMAPPEIGLDGSTAATATLCPRARSTPI